VEDVDALAAELRVRGTKIRNPPTDPDGNVLWFGSDPKKGEPYGPFLDMHGRLRPALGRAEVCE
jgi:hypothetical protein